MLKFPQGTAALAVQRKILADNASNNSEAARALRIQALSYALKRNSWQSVQLLLNAGVSLPNRDSSLKGLYPREHDASSNDDTAVPNSLCSFMLAAQVQDLTLERLFQAYRNGILTDDTTQNKHKKVSFANFWEVTLQKS